jgi:hypothetical protein
MVGPGKIVGPIFSTVQQLPPSAVVVGVGVGVAVDVGVGVGVDVSVGVGVGVGVGQRPLVTKLPALYSDQLTPTFINPVYGFIHPVNILSLPSHSLLENC